MSKLFIKFLFGYLKHEYGKYIKSKAFELAVSQVQSDVGITFLTYVGKMGMV